MTRHGHGDIVLTRPLHINVNEVVIHLTSRQS